MEIQHQYRSQYIMNNKTSRRKFITTATAGAATGLLPAALFAKNAVSDIPQSGNNGLVFLFQGDSITDGNRGRNTDPNHIMGHGYAFAVASRVGADFPALGFAFYNRGISGNTIPDLQQRWKPDTIAIQPDVLSLLIGINDTAAVVENKPVARTADEFEIGYRALLLESKAAKPATLFILGLPFVAAVGKRKENFDRWKEEAAQRSARIEKLASEFDALTVNYQAVFDKAIKKAPAEYWIWDGIHPTVAGHELMAREWIKQAGKRLGFLKHYHY